MENERQDPVQREPATRPPSLPSSSSACNSVRHDPIQQSLAARLRSGHEPAGIAGALRHLHSGEHPVHREVHREQIASPLGEKPIGAERFAILYLDAAAGAEDPSPLHEVTEAGTRNNTLCNVKSPGSTWAGPEVRQRPYTT